MSASYLLLAGEGKAAIPTPVARSPLPPWDPDSVDAASGAPLPVHTTLNLAQGPIPPLADSTYMRADLWSMTLPGLEAIPGGAGGAAQERMLTYLFDRYSRASQDRGLKQYGDNGYRQWWRSIPDSRPNQTIQQYCDDTKRILDAGLIPCHFLRSKDYDGRNPDPTLVYPWVEALLAIDGIPEACHAWEASIFYDPDRFSATLVSDALNYSTIRWGVHLQSGYAHFGPNLPPGNSVRSAREFWLPAIAVGVKRLHYQCDQHWTAGMMQARGNDVGSRLIAGGAWGLPETVDWDAFEVVAQCQFNNEHDGDGNLADEDHGNRRGLEMLCTPGPLAPRGFGNGARYEDGSVI